LLVEDGFHGGMVLSWERVEEKVGADPCLLLKHNIQITNLPTISVII
jgi:hypothetical protein